MSTANVDRSEVRRTCCTIAVKHGFRSWRDLDGLRVEVDGLLKVARLVERVTPCLEGCRLFDAFL